MWPKGWIEENGPHSVALQHNGVKSFLENLLIAVFLIGRLQVLPDFKSGSPANFQNPDCPETGHFPSGTHQTLKDRNKLNQSKKLIIIKKN